MFRSAQQEGEDTLVPLLHPTAKPWFMIAVLTAYVLLVKHILPRVMHHRKPFVLKGYILLYNLAQVMACIYIDYQVWSVMQSNVVLFWQCHMVTPTQERERIQLGLAHFNFWLKISELSETIVFALRKKQNQISNLHVFHHCSMVTLYYIMVNVYHGQPVLYPMFLNSNVHIIMYSYYMVAAVASKRTLNWMLPLKKSITVMQMLQFVLILIQAFLLITYCEVPFVITVYYSIVVGAIFYGFYDFYKNSYRPTKHTKH